MATRNQIIHMVMVKMDELTPFPEGLVLLSPPTAPLKPIEETINSILNECANDLLLAHPIHRLTADRATPVIVGQTDGSGLLLLPTDFLRLVSLKIVGFNRPVTEVITVADPRYKLQYQAHTRGGKAKPTATRETAFVTNTLVDSLHYFSLTPGDVHTLEHFYFIKRVVAEVLKDELLEGLAWLVASKALIALGHVPEGTKAFELYNLFNQRS